MYELVRDRMRGRSAVTVPQYVGLHRYISMLTRSTYMPASGLIYRLRMLIYRLHDYDPLRTAAVCVRAVQSGSFRMLSRVRSTYVGYIIDVQSLVGKFQAFKAAAVRRIH